MPRVGPPPKDPRKRARTNSDPLPVRYVENRRIEQPRLEDLFGDENPMTGETWPKATIEFWESLAHFPTTENLQESQWRLLARAMMLDALILKGVMKAASEQRMQLAKFGIAPDDVARLRIFFADADEKEERGEERRNRKAAVEEHPAGARARYGGLRAVGDD